MPRVMRSYYGHSVTKLGFSANLEFHGLAKMFVLNVLQTSVHLLSECFIGQIQSL